MTRRIKNCLEFGTLSNNSVATKPVASGLKQFVDFLLKLLNQTQLLLKQDGLCKPQSVDLHQTEVIFVDKQMHVLLHDVAINIH